MNNDSEVYELDYSSQPTTTVKFSLSGADLVPEEITKQLGLAPSRSWSKGDAIPKEPRSKFTPRATYPLGKWILDAPCSKFSSYEVQIDQLLRLLEVSPKAAIELINAYDGELSVAYSSAEDSIGFYMDIALVRRISVLGLSFNLTIYPVFDEDNLRI